MEFECIILEKMAEIAALKLNRPKVLNALNRRMWLDLDAALDEVQQDSKLKMLLVTGEGKAFSTGDDPADLQGQHPAYNRRYLVDRQRICRRIIRFEKPTIAAVNGYALGSGFELAVACDIRISADEAQIGLPEARTISTLTGGASRILQALIGPGKTFELLFTGDYIDGREAERIGLVNRSVPLKDLMEEATGLAAKIAAKPSGALNIIKKGQLMAQEPISLEALLDYEIEARLACVAAREGEEIPVDFENRKKTSPPET